MVEVIWTTQAISDLDNIAEYIARDSLKYARSQAKRIYEYTQMLATQPLLGRVVPELKNKSIRELISGNYRIIYRITNNQLIEILTVHHSARSFLNSPFYQ